MTCPRASSSTSSRSSRCQTPSEPAPSLRDGVNFGTRCLPFLLRCKIFFTKTALFSKTQRMFSDFVNQMLFFKKTDCQSSLMNKFSLAFSCSQRRHRPLITSWIRCGINAGITELKVDLYDEFLHRSKNYWNPDGFRFDFRYLMDTRVKTVEFCYCDIIVPSSSSSSSAKSSTLSGDRFASLQSIRLVGFELTDTMVSDLLTLCKNLENFSLDRFRMRGANNLRICHPKLKELKVGNFRSGLGAGESSIEIRCRNLLKISVVSFYVGNYYFKSVPCLTEAVVDFPGMTLNDYDTWKNVVNLLTGVQRLSIENHWLRFLGPRPTSSSPFKLNNLTHLELVTGYEECDLLGLEQLLLHCPVLQTMNLNYLYYSPGNEENLKEDYLARPFEFHIPCLKEVKMRNFRETMVEIFVMILLNIHKVVLEKMVLVPSASPSEPVLVNLDLL